MASGLVFEGLAGWLADDVVFGQELAESYRKGRPSLPSYWS